MVPKIERNVTKLAPHESLKSIAWDKLTFGARVVLHRVDRLGSAALPKEQVASLRVGRPLDGGRGMREIEGAGNNENERYRRARAGARRLPRVQAGKSTKRPRGGRRGVPFRLFSRCTSPKRCVFRV